MSVRRGASAPSVASRTGTLCGPAITVAPGHALHPVVVATGGPAALVKFKKAVRKQQEPFSKLEREGIIVARQVLTDGVAYAVKDRVDDTLWWYQNVLDITRYSSMHGTKRYVKKRGVDPDSPESDVQLTHGTLTDYRTWSDYDPEEHGIQLQFKEGTLVRFVAYTHIELLFEDGLLVVEEQAHGLTSTHLYPLPSHWGVATSVRLNNPVIGVLL